MTHQALAERCRGYFGGRPAASHHKFFNPWKRGLEDLEASYESGKAVHLDLSPRPTRYISDLEPGFESELFPEMAQRDL
jgi:hypothetical protein